MASQNGAGYLGVWEGYDPLDRLRSDIVLQAEYSRQDEQKQQKNGSCFSVECYGKMTKNRKIQLLRDMGMASGLSIHITTGRFHRIQYCFQQKKSKKDTVLR